MRDMQRSTHSDEVLDLVALSLLYTDITTRQHTNVECMGISDILRRDRKLFGRTLSLAAVLGSMTCLRSLESAFTLLPTSPEWSTNDLGLPSPVGFAPSLLLCVRVLLCTGIAGLSKSAGCKTGSME